VPHTGCREAKDGEALSESPAPCTRSLRLASESLSQKDVGAPGGLHTLAFFESPDRVHSGQISAQEEVCAAFAQGTRRRRLSRRERRREERHARAELEAHRVRIAQQLGLDPDAAKLQSESPGGLAEAKAASPDRTIAASMAEVPNSRASTCCVTNVGCSNPGDNSAHTALGSQSPSAISINGRQGDCSTPAPQQGQELPASPTRFFTPASELPSPSASETCLPGLMYTTLQVVPSPDSAGILQLSSTGWRKAGAAGEEGILAGACAAGSVTVHCSNASGAMARSSDAPLLGAASTAERRSGRGWDPGAQASTGSSAALVPPSPRLPLPQRDLVPEKALHAKLPADHPDNTAGGAKVGAGMLVRWPTGRRELSRRQRGSNE
jgi:hypothetical protein